MDLSLASENLLFSSSKAVTNICHSLFEDSEVDYFGYERYYNEYHSIFLTTNPAAIKVYLSQDLYPKQQELELFFETGYHITFLSELMPLPAGASKYDEAKYRNNILMSKDHQINHRICFVHQYEAYNRICVFGSNTNSPRIFEYFINSIPVFESFIEYFEDIGANLINQYQKRSNILLPKYIDNNLIIKKNKKNNPYHLTNREIECARLNTKGYTAKEIAERLQISHRTVEKHIYNTKEKIGPTSKKTLRYLLDSLV